jgi:hypothetical protein
MLAAELARDNLSINGTVINHAAASQIVTQAAAIEAMKPLP